MLDALTPSVSHELVEGITRKINANAQAFTVTPGNCHITEFHTNTIACTSPLRDKYARATLLCLMTSCARVWKLANSPIEDRHSELLHDPQIYNGSLFGMYDGHAGWAGTLPCDRNACALLDCTANAQRVRVYGCMRPQRLSS
jgi:hypothetical protein